MRSETKRRTPTERVALKGPLQEKPPEKKNIKALNARKGADKVKPPLRLRVAEGAKKNYTVRTF